MLEYRPLLQTALGGSEGELQKEIKDEEELERKGDRIYWEPLRKDLENWRRAKVEKNEKLSEALFLTGAGAGGGTHSRPMAASVLG